MHDNAGMRARVSNGMLLRLARAQQGSATIEYVGLALVVSMLMAALASAIDSAMGEQLARALIKRLVDAINQ
jgi:Flp pilus assembly pilin Flp